MRDDRDNKIYVDENGERWLIDGDGNIVTDEFGHKLPPMKSREIHDDSGFTTYDTSQGHCGLCGRLTCRGECFK